MTSLTEPEVHEEDEECGRCHRETRVVDVGCYGSDPYIQNLLCVVCLFGLIEAHFEEPPKENPVARLGCCRLDSPAP